MSAKILPENSLRVNISDEIARAAGLGAQVKHDLFRAESILKLLTTTAALARVGADQHQAILVTVAELVGSARNTASVIETLAD